MAVSGGATSAFIVTVVGGQHTLALEARKITIQSNLCISLENAVLRLQQGEAATIRASDMDKLRHLWITLVSGEVTG